MTILVDCQETSAEGVNESEITDVNKAVIVQNASKSYGVGKRRSSILRSLDMTVQKGTIYGLLGPSGCGKTTLLSCIVGRRSLDSGEVYVFGSEPGTKESGIPGPRVGYMPQELALYGEFTIKETLEYFGRIYNLPNAFIQSQIDFLSNLLDLPPGHRRVNTLSGGQQRRVSFAVALFHDPELLILDEPTVGVDPLLRQNIWNHLIHLSSIRGKTIIITTHYIEETRQSNKIGMMRSGRLLVEESPNNLLYSHGLDSLEDVFLKLCVKSESMDTIINTTTSPGGTTQIVFDDEKQLLSLKCPHISSPQLTKFSNSLTGVHYPMVNEKQKSVHSAASQSLKKPRNCIPRYSAPSFHRIMALTRKNCLQTFRNVGMFLFIFILPVAQAILFCLAVGHDPTSLEIAVVNEELDPSQGRICSYNSSCVYSMLSCRFLRFINNETIVQIPYSNYSEALEATRERKVYGVIHFGKNFSDQLKIWDYEGQSSSLQTILERRISVTLDWADHQTKSMLQRRLMDTFDDFSKDWLKSCSQLEEASNIPVAFLDPVYGSKKPSFAHTITPGAILSVLYTMAVALTSITFVAERKSGLLDRSLVAGIQSSEILLAHVMKQFFVLLGQTALVLIFILYVFHVPCHGSLALAFFIALIQGFCGMSFGFVISSLCNEEICAIQMSLGSFYPNVLFSGVLWPVEGMPVFMRYIAYCMPQTYAIESLRSVFARGWGIERPDVYAGILISLGWIFAMLISSLVVLRIRKYTG